MFVCKKNINKQKHSLYLFFKFLLNEKTFFDVFGIKSEEKKIFLIKKEKIMNDFFK
jgi:hypothetical protein